MENRRSEEEDCLLFWDFRTSHDKTKRKSNLIWIIRTVEDIFSVLQTTGLESRAYMYNARIVNDQHKEYQLFLI